jgi:hypothetical protein
MLTIIVGAYPDLAEEFVGENDKFKLHPDRAEHAEFEYNKKLNTWKTLLRFSFISFKYPANKAHCSFVTDGDIAYPLMRKETTLMTLFILMNW